MLSLIENEEFISTHKTEPKYFTRDRVWNFKTTFLFICSLLNKRSQSEIDGFFSKLYQVPVQIRQVTASAFTQCRAKISFTAFKSVFNSLVRYYYENFSHKTYHGFRLVAVDGSVYTLPRTAKTIKEFGENVLSDNRKWIKAQVSFAADVLNNICIDAVIGPYRQAETSQAMEHFAKLGKDNLYIFDRGYFSRRFLKEVVGTTCQFCFRVQRNACKEIMLFIESDMDDTVGYILVEGQKIKVRLTKIILDTGEEEYLVTSLFDTKVFTVSKLKKLYHLRWGVEEQYKDMKYAICAENFVGKKPNSIKQEFFANILTYNIAMMTCKADIERNSNKPKKKTKQKKKRKYKANKRAILAKVKQCFVDLFYAVEEVGEILKQIIQTVSKESVPIREGRKSERGKTKKAKRKYSNTYVSVV